MAANSPIASSSLTGRVLVVDDHARARESMADVLRHAGHQVQCCSCAAEALQVLQTARFDCIVTDLKMPGMTGIDLIIQLRQRQCTTQIVMVTAHATVATAVEAMRHGAFDYIEKPFEADALERLVTQAMRHGRLVNPEPADALAVADATSPAMIGSSPMMQALRMRILQIGPTSETVLIMGESGTGKELVARAIHAASHRHGTPMVSLNCPVLSAHLMESELFGHERGAFTGADTPRTGRFEAAHGGTILLDEVTEIDLPLQAKLLRVLQEKSFERVGSCKTLHVDVRVLATTNRELQGEVAAGRFREDLYFRLAVLPLAEPPLRQRREDVPELAAYFFKRSARRLQRETCSLEPDAAELLVDYRWPGNVRELENIITRASVLTTTGRVTADELRRWLIAPPKKSDAGPRESVPVGISLEEMERRLIEATLEHYGGHRARTAKALGIGIRTLCGKLRQYGYAPREKSFTPETMTRMQ
ncbi:MAG: sigma-54-dependent transcriptional regulator [Thermoguttaceae bacterium]